MLNPLNRAAYEGCRLTRDPEAAVRATFGDDNCDVNRFIAGSTAQSWLVGTSPVDVAARWRGDWEVGCSRTSCSPRACTGCEGVIVVPPVVVIELN